MKNKEDIIYDSVILIWICIRSKVRRCIIRDKTTRQIRYPVRLWGQVVDGVWGQFDEIMDKYEE